MMSLSARRISRIIALVVSVAGVIGVVSHHAPTAHSQGATHGFLVDGGHLYLPYVYFHWTESNGTLTGMEETLEPSMNQDGYVAHRYPFTGHQSGTRITIRSTTGHFLWGAGGRLRFSRGRLYLRESQTGATWWAEGRPMPAAQWALVAIRFMECYTNPYDAGNPSRKCSNHG